METHWASVQLSSNVQYLSMQPLVLTISQFPEHVYGVQSVVSMKVFKYGGLISVF